MEVFQAATSSSGLDEARRLRRSYRRPDRRRVGQTYNLVMKYCITTGRARGERGAGEIEGPNEKRRRPPPVVGRRESSEAIVWFSGFFFEDSSLLKLLYHIALSIYIFFLFYFLGSLH